MSKENKKPVLYGVTAGIFFFAAVMNVWMIVAKGCTPFRVIAAGAFLMGGIILLSIKNWGGKSRS